MPLTRKGVSILEAMKETYGRRGKEVFYRSANKGTIKDVHRKKKHKKGKVC